ncbi:unnamed protein product [Heterobilharzia americana]|nr:unnamed protein product [Heterobilharzia americana]
MLKLSGDDLSGVTIHHPNQYFEEARKILQNDKDKSSTDKVLVKKVKMCDDNDDRLLQMMDMTDANFESQIDDSMLC